MEFSTFIVLLIAIFIIIYRVKTWKDVSPAEKQNDIVEEVVEYKVDENTTTASQVKSKPKPQVKKAVSKETKEKVKPQKIIKKTLKAGLAKNMVLLDASKNALNSQKSFELKSKPKRGVNTYVTLADAYTKDDRAVGIVYETEGEKTVIIKAFDVKMTNGQFKVSTSFSKSLNIKVEEMKNQNITATHYFINDENSIELENLSLTLK